MKQVEILTEKKLKSELKESDNIVKKLRNF
jgi:hypothetical protein